MVVFVISSLRTGGAERVLSYLANATPNSHIITFAPPAEACSYFLAPHVKLYNLGHNLTTPFSKSHPIHLLKAFYHLRTTIKTINPQVIVSFLDKVNIITLIMTRFLGIPVIVSERNDPYLRSIGKICERLRSLTYPFAKHIVCQTQNAAQYFSQPTHVIANPVPVFKNTKTNYGSIKNIVCVGRLEEQKEHLTLIQATSFFPNMTLTIYGEGVLRNDLEDFLNKNNIRNVFLPGVVKNIEHILPRFDLFVFPSRYEGFPNALCEAMSLGLPVIASKCSGNVDIVTDGLNGVLFDVGNVEELVQKIRYLEDNPLIASHLGKNATKISKTYSFEKVLDQWRALLEL